MTTARPLRDSRRPVALVAVMLALAAAATVSAHRLDECLQATRIDVQPARVRIELDVTPGVAVAGALIATIDRNGDGVVTNAEQQAYAADAIGALDLTRDGTSLALRLDRATFPDLQALRQGAGTIRLWATADHAAVSTGSHELSFVNRHGAPRSVYLANALVPESSQIAITDQRRNGAQSALTIAYVVGDEVNGAWIAWVLVGLSVTVGGIIIVTARS